jgi:MFS family permease
VAGGVLAAPAVREPWQLYATLGVLVGAGANLMGYTAQSLYLPNWFVRRRGLAIGVAFSGVGVGAVVLLPWLQAVIGRDGWRAACWAMGLLVLLVAALLHRSPAWAASGRVRPRRAPSTVLGVRSALAPTLTA